MRSLLDSAARHPIATATLIASAAGGSLLAVALIPADELSLLRRALGGALLGGLSWLLVMVGRAIGE